MFFRVPAHSFFSLNMDDVRDKIASLLRIEDKKLARELLAECIGTFFLLVCLGHCPFCEKIFKLIGNAANIQATVATGGNSTSAHIAWGIGFMFAVFLAASISGASLPVYFLQHFQSEKRKFLFQELIWTQPSPSPSGFLETFLDGRFLTVDCSRIDFLF